MKTYVGTQLESQIKKYITDTISKPRKKLGGLAICPFAKKFLSQTHIVITNDYAKTLDIAVQLMGVLGFEVVVIGGKYIKVEKIEDIVDRAVKKYKNYDVEILRMHPDTVEPPLPLEYNFKHSPLIIVQKRSTLQTHRKILEKRTDYYKYHK